MFGSWGLAALGFVVLGVAAVLATMMKFYKKVDQGRALIVNKLANKLDVIFTGSVVIPTIHRAEVMDISVKTIELERRGSEGLICQDNIRADIKVTFFIKVNRTAEDVKTVASNIGCARASDQKTLEELFIAKFSEALKTVGKKLDFEQLYTKRDDFRDDIKREIGTNLNGYILEDAAIDYLEQTPLEALDAQNILDAQGIRKITELTTQQNVHTNELKQKERMEIGAQDLKADEAVYRFDQQRADAEAKKAKEISIAQTREANEAARVKHEEHKKTELTRQKAEEEVQIGEENKMRAVEVAQKAREREVAVETVRVRKASDLEEISREREVELQRIDKEKSLEVERKNIADVIRSRVAVEKGVAQEEENIKDLRAHAEAERTKKVTIIGAEAEAQEALVKNIKAAEAEEEVAKHEARKKLTIAEANLEASDKEARAKIRMSEGVQAEEAASGLAKVRVAEAEAMAIEKQGAARANVHKQQAQAEAEGEELKGLAIVKVREAQAEATRKEGDAEADVVQGTKIAEAKGDEEKGLAAARVAEAEALAVEKRGIAEAVAIQKKLEAEALGLAEKASAMKALDGVGREHEEFRLELDKDKEVALEGIAARVQVAEAQAKVLAQAFDQAKINIVGGDGEFFERFINAVSMGQSLDGFMNHSETAQGALGGYVDGSRSLPGDMTEILGNVSPDKLKDLSLSALLGKLASGRDDATAQKLEKLANHARALGIDKLG